MKLEQIFNHKCTLCPLHKEANTICVAGEGNPKADLMLVGEAPGKEEDYTGRPFVGTAGNLLTNILAEFKIDRKDIYISNSVKCRPPENRRPHIKEIQTCRRYLQKEIQLVKPKLILALGQTAMATLLDLPTVKVAASRGKVFYSPLEEIGDIPLVITYHPAALARNTTLIEPMFQDFNFAMEILKNGIPERKECRYTKGVSKAKSRISFDLETEGFNPFISDRSIICVGTTNKPYRGCCTTDLGLAKDILEDKSILKIGHNIKFDIKWWKAKGNKFAGPIYDTMVAEHLINENTPSFGLKELASTYTDMGPYSAKFERQLELVGDINKVPLETLMNYCSQDVDATIRLYLRQQPILEEQGLTKLCTLVMAGERVMIEAELAGVKIDKEKRKEIAAFYTKKIGIIKHTIREKCGDDLENPDSSTQLGKILTGKLGLPIIKTTKGGKVSVDKYVLEELLKFDKSGLVRTIMKYRQYRGDYSKYLAPTKKFWQEDGKVHAIFNIHGTKTGRYSCVNPNLQQVPRNSVIKKLFVSRWGEKGKLVSFDYDQGELRLLAHMSRDRKLIKAFREGLDVHKLTASQLFKASYDSVSDEQRYSGKTINFGIMYGMGVGKLASETGMSEKSAARFLREYKEYYTGVKEYIRDRENEIEEMGYVTNLFGRRRRIPILDIENVKEVRRAHRQAVNSPIQGGLHELNVLSMVALYYWLRSRGARSKIILAVHDQVIVDCPNDEVEDICKHGKEIFDNPDTSRFGFELSVPTPVTVSVGLNWKEVRKLD